MGRKNPNFDYNYDNNNHIGLSLCLNFWTVVCFACGSETKLSITDIIECMSSFMFPDEISNYVNSGRRCVVFKQKPVILSLKEIPIISIMTKYNQCKSKSSPP